MTLVLSLFPGIGLLDMALEEEGFVVVRGPDLIFNSLSDIRKFHPPAGKFDGVIGGPPCQAFSRLRHLVAHNGYKVAENLIPEFERVVDEARPDWFLMENVREAPIPFGGHSVGYWIGDQRLNNRHCGGVQNRERRFTFGHRIDVPLVAKFHVVGEALEPAAWEPAVLASGGSRTVPVAVGGSGKRKRSKASDLGYKTRSYAAAAAAQGLPDDFDLPAFTTSAKIKAIGNGVPLPMGRAVARAVKRALGMEQAA